MRWKIEYLPLAIKDLKKIDHQMRERVRTYLENRIAHLDDPREVGVALKSPKFKSLWRYRLGDYRIICEIEDNRLVILTLRVGHRKAIYED